MLYYRCRKCSSDSTNNTDKWNEKVQYLIRCVVMSVLSGTQKRFREYKFSIKNKYQNGESSFTEFSPKKIINCRVIYFFMMKPQEETYNKFWLNLDIIYPNKKKDNIVTSFLKKNKKVLEIGPGVQPCALGKNMYFVDISEVLKEKYLAIGCNFTHGNCIDLPYNDEEFDLVVALEILEHIKEDTKALKEINRILKNDGLLLISVPINSKFWNRWDDLSNHIRRYDIEDLLKKLRKSEFKVEKYKIYNTGPKSLQNAAAILVEMLFLFHMDRIIQIFYKITIKMSSYKIKSNIKWETKDLINQAHFYEHIFLQCRKIVDNV